MIKYLVYLINGRNITSLLIFYFLVVDIPLETTYVYPGFFPDSINVICIYLLFYVFVVSSIVVVDSISINHAQLGTP